MTLDSFDETEAALELLRPDRAGKMVHAVRKETFDVFSRNDLLWTAQNEQMHRLNRLSFEPPESVFGKVNMLEAFKPLEKGETVFVGCPDDRCGTDTVGENLHRFCIPGTGVLRSDVPQDALLKILRGFIDRGVKIVTTYHDHCGACKAKASLMDTGKSPEQLGFEAAKTLAKQIGMPEDYMPLHMGYDHGEPEITQQKSQGLFLPMRGYPDFHDGRKMIIDLSNRMFGSSFLGIKPFMKLNRHNEDPEEICDDALLLLGIMMDGHHAPGKGQFENHPYLVMVIGADGADTERADAFSAESFTALLKQKIADTTDFAKAVKFVKFQSPSRDECIAYQKAKPPSPRIIRGDL